MSTKRDAKREADEAVLDAERKTGKLVGVAAAASIAATVATLAVASSASGGSGLPKGTVAGGDAVIDRAKVLIRFDANQTELAIATGLRCLGLLLMIVVSLFLIRLVRTRDATASASCVDLHQARRRWSPRSWGSSPSRASPTN